MEEKKMRMSTPTKSHGSMLITISTLAFLALAYSPGNKTLALAPASKGRIWVIYSSNYDLTQNAIADIYEMSNSALLGTAFLSTNGNGNARGIAFDPSDGNFWYSTLLPGTINGQHPLGDGFIHKKPTLGGADITTIPDPGGVGGPGIGALDFDPEENVLWAATYWPVNGQVIVYGLDPSNGNVLKTHSLPFRGTNCCGNTTLTIARPADLGGAKVLLTTAGYSSPLTLYALDISSGALLQTYVTLVNGAIWGIDVDDATGDLIYVTTDHVRNLGPAPYLGISPTTAVNIQDRTPQYIWADISLENVTPLIFVPGIAGSVLKANGGSELWPGKLQDHSRLTLDPSKPQENISPTDAVRSITVGSLIKLRVYEPLIEKLKLPVSQGGGGLTEYSLSGNPSQCDLSQRPNRPTLFVFPYDWRKSNAENATALTNYVGCVRQFFSSTTRVNILAHSMGGLLARRYILDNSGAHNVNKLITIGTPWLGAPETIHILETGKLGFFPLISDSTGKELVKFFPGTHELLPSPFYFSLGGRPFEERGFDLNVNRQKFELYNTYDQFKSMLETRFPKITSAFPMGTPGTNNSLFHTRQGQDDWRNDPTGVQYYHFFGRTLSRTTIGRTIAVPEKKCDPSGTNCVNTVVFKTEKTFGDETVPVLSSERRGNDLDLNAPGAIVLPFRGEHVALTKDSEVQNAVLNALKTTRQIPLPGSTQNPSGEPPDGGVPAYYFTVDGVDYVTVADCCGNTNDPIGETLFRGEVPGVGFNILGERIFEITMPTSVDLAIIDFTITFRTGTEPIFVELLEGDGKEAPSLAIRYRDLNLPPGVTVQLKINETGGVGDLRYDADGDGTFETVIPPTASLNGQPALDVDPPTVSITGTYQQGAVLVAVTANDSGSGVKSLRYSLDGAHYQSYSGPFTVNFAQSQAVFAYADDNAGNRGVDDILELKPLLSPVGQFIPRSGGRGIVDLTAPDGFSWTVTANDNWIVLTSPDSGSGPGRVTSEMRENFTGSARFGTMTIAGQTFTVLQNTIGCSYEIQPASALVSGNGGGGSISLTAPAQCGWQAVSDVPWITITSANMGIGNTVLAYSVAPNPGPIARKGRIVVGGKTFNFKQTGL